MKEIFFCKKNLYFTVIYAIISVCIVIFISNDTFLYKDEIGIVTHGEVTDKIKQKSPNMKTEKYYVQTLNVKILNGKHKGKEVMVENCYSKSEVKTVKYTLGDEVFLKVTDKESMLSGTITGFKRDTVVAAILLIFIYCLVLVAGMRGIAFVAASAVNVAILYLGLDYYAKGTDILPLCYVMVVLFTVVSLVCISGFNKSTIISIASVLLVLILVAVIYKIVLSMSEQPDYIMLEYVSGPNDLNKLFFTEIIMGCLGAVMDVAVSVSETSCELLKENKMLKTADYIKSMRVLGADVMGTMVNILFYAYFCSAVPMILVQMKNKYKLNFIFRFDLPFELTRFLTGSIGIILTIPVTAFVSWLVLYKILEKRKCTE